MSEDTFLISIGSADIPYYYKTLQGIGPLDWRPDKGFRQPMWPDSRDRETATLAHQAMETGVAVEHIAAMLKTVSVKIDAMLESQDRKPSMGQSTPWPMVR